LPAALRNPYLQIALVAGFLPCLLISRGAIHAPQVILPIGAALLAFGFYAVRRRQCQPGMFWDAMAWSCALGGAAVLAGLPWLGVIAVAAALAVVIDSHIAPAWSLAFPTFDAATDQPTPSFWARVRLPSQYLLFSLVTLVIALSKAHA